MYDLQKTTILLLDLAPSIALCAAIAIVNIAAVRFFLKHPLANRTAIFLARTANHPIKLYLAFIITIPLLALTCLAPPVISLEIMAALHEPVQPPKQQTYKLIQIGLVFMISVLMIQLAAKPVLNKLVIPWMKTASQNHSNRTSKKAKIIWGVLIGSVFTAVILKILLDLEDRTIQSLAYVAPEDQEVFEFLAVGDMPYDEDEEEIIRNKIIPTIADTNLPFVIHVGDLKKGSKKCTDKRLRRNGQLVKDLMPGKVFYTPGDNDWTDCDRDDMSELERLDFLRDLMFSKEMELPVHWDHARQAGYPENARWRLQGVQFATLHVVGSNNGRDEIDVDPVDLVLDRVDARDQANLTWMRTAFASAQQSEVKALVLAMQADTINNTDYRRPCTSENRDECNAYANLLTEMRQLAKEFDHPVLLIHGSTRPYCWDRNFGGTQAPKLQRINILGDYTDTDATVIRFDPTHPERFSARGLLWGEKPDEACG